MPAPLQTHEPRAHPTLVDLLARISMCPSRVVVYLPGLSPEFEIKPGLAYIVANSRAETVSLP